MSSSNQPTDLGSWRRMHAYELRQQGWSQTKIATALGVSQGSVSGWLRRATEEGIEALRTRFSPGRPPNLSSEHREALAPLLAQGAEFHGFVGQFWSRERVQVIIERHFSVHYSLQSVGRVLAEIGYTLQKPAKRAVQRDESAIAEWREKRWPELKKKP